MARPTWTRKTYEMAAETIGEALAATDSIDGQLAVEKVAHKLGARFKADNPQFDLHRFLSACGF